MKSLCITGVCQADLDQIAEVLRAAGTKDGKPAERDEAVDIHVWHEQVLAAAEDSGDPVAALMNPGRLWEQLASDIFLANLTTKCWGWAQTQSTFLLNFWAAFEPRLQFVLVCNKPEHWLVHELLSQQDAPVEVDESLSTWSTHHEALLRFYHRNADRCVLVDVQNVLGNAQVFVDQLITRWKLPLQRAQVGASPEAPVGALPQYIAQQALLEHRSTRALQDELAATLTRMGALNPSESSNHWADLLAEYQALADQKKQLMLQAEAQAEIEAKQEEIKQLQTRLKDAEEENELLLLQLHQVQEELEHYFLKHKESENQNKVVQGQLSAAQDRWQRMLKRQPDYFEYETIEVTNSPEGTGLSWSIRGLEAGGKSLELLEFKSVIVNGVAGIVLPADSKPLLHRPLNADTSQEITLLPAGDRQTAEQRLITLLNLSSSDWYWVRCMASLLGGLLKSRPLELSMPASVDAQAHAVAFEKLRDVLDRLPYLLRYDELELKPEQVNPDYEHLWLRIKNPSLGNQTWPEFEFRLSCANLRPNTFGQYPKLEFPEEGKQAFEGWFEESSDDFGAKLELRFALPHSADLAVWSRLSVRDQALVAAVIVRLPNLLAELQSKKISLKRPVADWLAVARSIKDVYEKLLARPVSLPASPSPPPSEPLPVPPAISLESARVSKELKSPKVANVAVRSKTAKATTTRKASRS